MAHGLPDKAFLTDTLAEVMELPVSDVADSKEMMINRAVCDERITIPLQALRDFPEVYAMDRIGGEATTAEVTVNWRCNTEQWWVAHRQVPRFRFGADVQTGNLSNAIWEIILRNPEAAALQHRWPGHSGRRCHVWLR